MHSRKRASAFTLPVRGGGGVCVSLMRSVFKFGAWQVCRIDPVPRKPRFSGSAVVTNTAWNTVKMGKLCVFASHDQLINSPLKAQECYGC